MKRKIKVAVLMGGMSSEHDVSMISGKEIVKNLNREKYLVTPIAILKDGRGLEKITRVNPDIAFIALHGKYGEDGKIQGFLDTLGIKYTGSGVSASAIGMDKIIFRKLMKAEGLPIPKYYSESKGRNTGSLVPISFKPPYFVKPHNQGSSIGVSFVKKRSDLESGLRLAYKYSDIALVDEFIEGLEINCGVLGNKDPVALPAIEIHPMKNEFFDYESKYAKNGSEEITPARISPDATKRVQDLAVKVYKVVGVSGFARVDFILQNDGKPVILEINTIPGMTSTSLLPKEAKAAGITYSCLLDKIIKYALEKY